jgi:aminoglycoside phosphotransferase (APT) family kinase protein
MHADEVGTDVSLVRRLLAAQFPQWAGLPVTAVPSSGTDNALYRLGADLAVRLPRIGWAVDHIAKEQRWLPRLTPHLPLPVPVPLAQGAPGEGYPYPWSVVRWLDGEEAALHRVGDLSVLAADLAHFVTALHRVEVGDPPPALPPGRGVPLATRDDLTRSCIATLAGTVDTAAVTAAWETALRAPAWDGAPVWVHGDLAPGNLLLTGGRLSGVLDFGLLTVGDPAVDLLPAWNLFPTDVRYDYGTALGVDDATWARGRGWALSVALVALPYYRDTNPVITALSEHVLHEVLADS